jgi:hypothetical protein
VSTSDDVPFWTYESLHEASAYEDRYEMLMAYFVSIDSDDLDYPPADWESGVCIGD